MIQGFAFPLIALVAVVVLGVNTGPAVAEESYQDRPQTPCSATPKDGQAVDPLKVFTLPVAPDAPNAAQRCDVAPLALSVADEGRFTPIYAHDQHLIQPTQQIELVIAHIKDLARVARVGASNDPGHSAPLRLLLYAHGGLVLHADAVKRAEVMAPLMIADGYQPIFLIWNSDLYDAYRDRLCCVLNGQASKRALVLLAPVRAAGDILTGIARAPESFIIQAIRFNDSVINQNSLTYFLCDDDGWRKNTGLGEIGPPNPACAPGNISAYRKSYSQGAETVVYPPFRSWNDLNDRLHRIGGPEVVYELNIGARGATTSLTGLGEGAWENLVRRERMGFQPPSPIAVKLQTPTTDCAAVTAGAGLDQPWEDKQGPSGFFFAFLSRLQCELQQDADLKYLTSKKLLTLDLVGHSMGALVDDEVMAYFPNLPYRRIVYMAAATPIRDFVQSAGPIIGRPIYGDMGQTGGDRVAFYNLMLHPIAESHEVHWGGILPEGSLLEWVDEYFERPRSPDGLMLGKWSNIRGELARFTPDQRKDLYLRIFPAQAVMRKNPQLEDVALHAECTHLKPLPEVRRCHPVQHGDFDQFSFWRDRFLLGDYLPSASNAAP